MYVCVYIYIYIYRSGMYLTYIGVVPIAQSAKGSAIRPVHLLKAFLLRVLESNFRETPCKIQRT